MASTQNHNPSSTNQSTIQVAPVKMNSNYISVDPFELVYLGNKKEVRFTCTDFKDILGKS